MYTECGGKEGQEDSLSRHAHIARVEREYFCVVYMCTYVYLLCGVYAISCVLAVHLSFGVEEESLDGSF